MESNEHFAKAEFYETKVGTLCGHIQSLGEYFHDTTVDISNVSELSDKALEKLTTESGQRVLETWLRAFRGSVNNARTYLEDMRETGDTTGADEIAAALRNILSILNRELSAF